MCHLLLRCLCTVEGNPNHHDYEPFFLGCHIHSDQQLRSPLSISIQGAIPMQNWSLVMWNLYSGSKIFSHARRMLGSTCDVARRLGAWPRIPKTPKAHSQRRFGGANISGFRKQFREELANLRRLIGFPMEWVNFEGQEPFCIGQVLWTNAHMFLDTFYHPRIPYRPRRDPEKYRNNIPMFSGK